MSSNKSKNKFNEDKLNENYDLWMNNKITDQQYFREVNRIRGSTF